MFKKIALISALDITFIVSVLLIIRNRRTNGKLLGADSVFLLGATVFLIIFLSFSIFSVIVYSIPVLLNSIAGTSGFVAPGSSVSSYPLLILTHNMIFLSEIFLGSFFLLLPTFGVVLFDALVTGSITVYLIRIGQENIILPQLLLELIGTCIATATSFTIFHTFFTSMSKKTRDSEYMQMQSYSVRLIIFGLALSIYAFLLAWSIELTLFSAKGLTSLWYNTVYLFDVITIIIYVGFLYDVLKRKVFPMQQMIIPSLSSGIILFVALAGGPTAIESSIPFLMVLGFTSLLYPLLELRKAMIGDKTLKRLNAVLKGFDCFMVSSQGRSMYPTITGGDYVLCLRMNEDFKLSIGDIITYEPPLYYSPLSYARFVTHRIVELNEVEFRTRGDNLQKLDPPTKNYKVYGLAIAKCDHSLKIFEPLTHRQELVGILTGLESSLRTNVVEIVNGRLSAEARSLLSIIFLIPAIALPFLFLMVSI